MEYVGMPYCLSLWCTFGDGTMTLTYDAKGKMNNALASGITTSYAINYQGLRVKRANTNETKLFVHDEAEHILGEYDQNGNALQESFWLGDTPVAISGLMPCLTGVNGCTEQATAYIWTDHLNTPRELTRLNASNLHVSIWKWDSLPFGETSPNANPSNLGLMTFNHRLPGQYKDSETGLHQNWNRDYDPVLGRYVTRDPVGLIAGPNTYLYANGVPVSKVDREGLDAGGLGPGSYACFEAGTFGAGNGSPHVFICSNGQCRGFYPGSPGTGEDMLLSRGQINKGGGWYIKNKLAICQPLHTGDACSASSFGQCLLAEMDKQAGDIYSIIPSVGKSCIGAAGNAIQACAMKCALGRLGK